MILQANIHFEENNTERMISCLCRNGKELAEAINERAKQKLGGTETKKIFLDNIFQKIFAIPDTELIRIPIATNEEKIEEIYNIIYHITCQKGYNVIAFILTDQDQNVNKKDGKELLQEFENYKKEKTAQPQTRKSQASTNDEIQQSNKKIKKILEKTHKSQVYSLKINAHSCRFLKEENSVEILSNFEINNFKLYETNLKWSDIDSPNNQNIQDGRNWSTQIKLKQKNKIENSKKVGKKDETNQRFESLIQFSLEYPSQNKELIFIFNDEIIAYQFPLIWQK